MITDELISTLREEIGSSFVVHNYEALAGGDINFVYKISSSEGDFCIKINDRIAFPKMFKKEALGLQLLRDNSAFTVPNVIHEGESGSKSYLLLSYINEGSPTPKFWSQFGEQLAEMHKHSQVKFGLDHDNYIGSLHQGNTEEKIWSSFYVNQRLVPQVKLAIDQGYLGANFSNAIRGLYSRLEALFPNEPPALLHGDLWSGNYMVDHEGNPALIDPAVYFGHREMDLAMTKLFGGFNPEMYKSYHATYPLEDNWEERVALCQLYPILVHVNLFGRSYATQAQNIVSKYS